MKLPAVSLETIATLEVPKRELDAMSQKKWNTTMEGGPVQPINKKVPL